MLPFDDAGWGCLVGGVVIGCYRVPPDPAPGAFQQGGEFVSGVIAPSYFQNDDAEELAAWLDNPAAVKQGSWMPDYGLTPEEIDAVVAYLQGLT